MSWLKHLGKPVWVVADGAYATAPFPKPMRALAVTVVRRRRKDAALWTVPGPRPGHRRGPQRTYGEHRIDLAKRGGQTRGWATGTFTLYGEATVKRYTTFVATWRPAGGAIRVALVDEPNRWVALFCTDTAATVTDILGSVAGRFSLEVTFRDLKDVVGAGQQQVRRVRASAGAFHVCPWTFTMTEAWAWGRGTARRNARSSPWTFTMTEAWAWGRGTDGLIGHRTASPGDNGTRRPSHADKRRAWRREVLAEQIHAVLRPGLTGPEIRAAAERLLDLAA